MLKTNKVWMVPIVLIVMLLGACSENESATGTSGEEDSSYSGIIPVYTPGSGGLIYMLSAGISQAYEADGTELVTESTNGSAEIMQAVIERYQNNAPAFGGIAASTVFDIYEGQYDKIEGAHDEIRGVSFLGYTALHIVTREGSGISDLGDIKGKKIGASPGAADTELIMTLLEEQYGLTEDDYEYVPLGYAEIQQGLDYGSIDVGVINGGVPAPLVQETESMTDIEFVSIDEEKLNNFIKDHPYYGKTTFEEGTYESQDGEHLTPTMQLIFTTHEDTEEQIVYDFVKTILENREELISIHPTAENINEDTILDGIEVPLHEGAKKYYQEKGIIE